MTLKRIRLELARSERFPEGSSWDGYEFVAPLDATGRIDSEQWKGHKKECRARRFLGDGPDEHGYLIHTRHRSWAFSYAPGEDDDTPFFRFEDHPFREGEYVSIAEEGGAYTTYKVVEITDASAIHGPDARPPKRNLSTKPGP